MNSMLRMPLTLPYPAGRCYLIWFKLLNLTDHEIDMIYSRLGDYPLLRSVICAFYPYIPHEHVMLPQYYYCDGFLHVRPDNFNVPIVDILVSRFACSLRIVGEGDFRARDFSG